MKIIAICLICAIAWGEKIINISDPINYALKSEENLLLISKCGIELTKEGKITAPKVHFQSIDAPQIHGVVEADEIRICCERGRLNLDDATLSGAIIIDPKYVLIQLGGADPATGNTFASDPSGTVTIDGATLASAIDSGSVTNQTNTDITIEDNVIATTFGNGLTLQAGRSVIFKSGSNITLNNGAFSVIINDEGADRQQRDQGFAELTMKSECSITTAGGNIDFDVGIFNREASGQINLNASTIDAGGGDISIGGISKNHDIQAGYYAANMTIRTSGIGTLTITGIGGVKTIGGIGINSFSSTYTVEDGNAVFIGTGKGILGSGNTNNYGMRCFDDTLESIGTGNISLTGTGGVGDDYNLGVLFSGNSVISAASGGVDITGTGGGGRSNNYGICIEGSTKISASSTGNLTMIGTGGGRVNTNVGVLITSLAELIVEAGLLFIDGTGTGQQNGNSGLVIESNASLCATGSGSLDIAGQSGDGKSQNIGIAFSSGIPMVVETGSLTMNGTSLGTGDNNQGIYISSISDIESRGTTASGDVTISGTGGTGQSKNYGFLIDMFAFVTSDVADITITGTSLVAGTEGYVANGDNNIRSTSGTITINNVKP